MCASSGWWCYSATFTGPTSCPPPYMSALCFLLPLVERLSHLRASRPVALVLGPVRELCIQTETVAKQLMQGEGDVLD